MTTQARARGSFNLAGMRWFRNGTGVLEKHTYLITSTYEDVNDGLRRAPLDPRALRPVEFFRGVASVFVPNPVEVFADPGPFALGSAGQAEFLRPGAGAFADFAIVRHPTADWVDPHYHGSKLGITGVVLTTTSARTQITFVPPKGAAYVVPEAQITGLAEGGSVYLGLFQMEVGDTATDFTHPRSLTPVPRADRVNLTTEPTRALTSHVDDKTFVVHGLVPGDLYTASAEVSRTRVISSTGEDIITWRDGSRNVLTFRANDTSATLTITGSSSSWSYRRLLVERGVRHLEWFDGDSGVDYLWEHDKTANTDARSFYYTNRDKRHWLLRQTVEQNAVLGTTANAPVYGVFRRPK